LWEISGNLHRADLTVTERSEHIAEWVKLTEDKQAQLAPVSERGRVEGRGNKGGINAAVRDLGIDRTEAQRAVKIASLTPEAKEADRSAVNSGHRSLAGVTTVGAGFTGDGAFAGGVLFSSPWGPR
jgi:hypothetical protein